MEEEKDLFGAEGKVALKYQSWDNIGDKVKGVLVEKRINNTPDKWGHTKAEYILMVNGERVCVQGRSYSKGQGPGTGHKVIFGMSEIPLGAIMGFVYTEDKETDQGNPAKIIEPRYLGDRDETTLKEYQEKFSGDTSSTVINEVTDNDFTVENVNEKADKALKEEEPF